MQVDAEVLADHALRIADVAGARRARSRSAGRAGRCGRRWALWREAASSTRWMSFSDTVLPRSATLALKRCEPSRPPDMLTMTPPTSTPAMRSAASIASRDGVLGCLEIDDRAALHAARALVADAEHLAAVGAPAQRARRLHRRQPRDQADDLRRADVENRQNRAAFWRGFAACAAGAAERSWLPFLFLRRVRLGPGRGRLLRQAHEHPVRGAEVERENVACRESAARAGA